MLGTGLRSHRHVNSLSDLTLLRMLLGKSWVAEGAGWLKLGAYSRVAQLDITRCLAMLESQAWHKS